MLPECRPRFLKTIVVDGLHGEYEMKTWGAVFKHVTLRRRIGPVLIISNAVFPFDPEEVKREFEQANAAYYRTVDWALDISAAEFDDCDIRGIPARLIRRDPETQAVVKRAKARRGDWREMSFGKAEWVKAAIKHMLEWGNEDVVLVAGKRAKDFRATLNAINLLRRAGIADPD